jgi:hypothetical protein
MPVSSSAVVLKQLKVMVKEQKNKNLYNNEYDQKTTSKHMISSNINPKKIPPASSIIFLKPTIPSVLMLQCLKVIVEEMTQLPQKKTSVPCKNRLSNGYSYNNEGGKSVHPKKQLSSELNQHPPNLPSTHRITIQDQAQAKMWLTCKQNLFDARRFLWRSDPFSCCLDGQRDRWLLICRALRALSRGNEDLLGDFYRWTYSGGDEGIYLYICIYIYVFIYI